MRIDPTAIVEDGAMLAPDVIVGPFCRVSARATLHEGVELKSHVVVDGRTTIGARTVVYPFAVVGGPPQHLGYRGEDTKLIIGADCIIREHSTLNLGTPKGRGQTVIGDKCFLMAGAHIAHDCLVGSNVVFANNASIAGHVVVEDFVFFGGLAGVHQFCRIGAYAFVGGCAAVTADIIPFGSAFGNHATLAGLNVIGLKRRGVSREAIRDLRAAYRLLFADHDSFQERLDRVAADYAHSEDVLRIVRFIQEDTRRPLMAPRRRSWPAGETLE